MLLHILSVTGLSQVVSGIFSITVGAVWQVYTNWSLFAMESQYDLHWCCYYNLYVPQQ